METKEDTTISSELETLTDRDFVQPKPKEEITDEQKHYVDLKLEMAGLIKMKVYIEADFNRINESRFNLIKHMNFIESEMQKIEQGQLLLKPSE